MSRFETEKRCRIENRLIVNCIQIIVEKSRKDADLTKKRVLNGNISSTKKDADLQNERKVLI